jgi:hypothetical protein
LAKKTTLIEAVEAHAANASQLATDAELARLRSEVASLKGRYKAALSAIDAERARADSIAGLTGIQATKRPLTKSVKGKKHAATMVVLLSDIHCEERVDPETVNGLNAYDLDVCEQRMAELLERFAVLLEHERQLARIDRVVVWLGGDLISGHIHPDTAEMAQLAPLSACRFIGGIVRNFIDQVADNASEVVVATNSGNHGRTTEKLRIGTEMEHSFEQHMYLTMAAAEAKKNVRWQVGHGYLNYVDLEGFRIRFHHGHAVKYGGGIGGITIPTNKAISAWDAIERADLTCFGHWHQFQWLRAGRYVANGSVIGHSAYATRIKAAYEPPCQACIVIDHGRHEVTKAMPIYCDRDLRKEKDEHTRNGKRRTAKRG